MIRNGHGTASSFEELQVWSGDNKPLPALALSDPNLWLGDGSWSGSGAGSVKDLEKLSSVCLVPEYWGSLDYGPKIKQNSALC